MVMLWTYAPFEHLLGNRLFSLRFLIGFPVSLQANFGLVPRLGHIRVFQILSNSLILLYFGTVESDTNIMN
jgi:lipid-A-disaccharide synthase-like uncharacterized protein